MPRLRPADASKGGGGSAEASAAALGEGAAVDIALETTGGTVPGQVVQVSPEIDSASQMVFVEARLASQQAGGSPVRSGLVARVHPAG